MATRVITFAYLLSSIVISEINKPLTLFMHSIEKSPRELLRFIMHERVNSFRSCQWKNHVVMMPLIEILR